MGVLFSVTNPPSCNSSPPLPSKSTHFRLGWKLFACFCQFLRLYDICTFLDTQVSQAPTHVSPSVSWSYFWISIAPEHLCATVVFDDPPTITKEVATITKKVDTITKEVDTIKCIFPKCNYPKRIFAKCTRLACRLSFASLFSEPSITVRLKFSVMSWSFSTPPQLWLNSKTPGKQPS